MIRSLYYMITWLIRLSPDVHNNSLAPGQRHSMLSVKCQHPILLVVGGTIMKLLLLLLWPLSVLGEAQEVRIEDDGKEARIDETSFDCVTAGEMLFHFCSVMWGWKLPSHSLTHGWQPMINGWMSEKNIEDLSGGLVFWGQPTQLSLIGTQIRTTF